MGFDNCIPKDSLPIPSNSHFCDLSSGIPKVSQYQKGKTNLDLLEQEIVSGSGIS